MSAIIRAYDATVDDVKPGERSVVAKIGGRAVDRHRTIIDPKGIDLASYRSNPIVLWEHGRDPQRGMMPVGRNLWIKTDGDRLIAKTVFRDDDYSQELFKAYQDGDLRGWSVNVLAHEASPPSREEIRATPDLAERCDLIYRRTELAEYSAVAIPSHRDALTVLASRGIWIPDDARTMTDSTGGLAGGGAAVEPQERYITHEDGKWIVHAEDGKVLGEHDSKADAEKQLAAVEAHKHDEGRALELPNLAGARSLVEIARTLSAERSEFKRALRDEVVGLIDLLVYGRV